VSELQVINNEGVFVVSSLDVAEMVGKRHSHLMDSIRSYQEVLANRNFGSHEFFISSSYTDLQGKERPCFYLTKKGCDMVANKMTGEKGILFTAAYVEKFYEMEKQVNQPKVLSQKEQLMASMRLSLETSEDVAELKYEVHQIKNMVTEQITIDYGEQRKFQKIVAKRVYQLASAPDERSSLFRELHREIKDRFGVASYKDIKRKDFESAILYIGAWIPKKRAS
jgi:Rha family phage regulatory protein